MTIRIGKLTIRINIAIPEKILRNRDIFFVVGIFFLINIFAIYYFLKPFSKEVVNIENFTEYYQQDTSEKADDVFEVLGRNFYTIKRNYNLKTKKIEVVKVEENNEVEEVEETEEIKKETGIIKSPLEKMKEEFFEKRQNGIVEKMVYEVKNGDTLTEIAEMFNQSMSIIRANNPNLSSKIFVGEKITLLTVNGIYYKVKSGDNLYDIASKYKVDIETIRKYNNLQGDMLRIGQEIFLKDPSLTALAQIGESFTMPISYKGVTSPYGNRFHPVLKRYIHHSGVDLVARYIPVNASKSGTVIFAGVAGGYGNLVKIKHSNGYETRYAHLNKIYVKKGQKVRQGQLIGQSGMTGRVTGPHLHFELRKNGKTLNPMKVIR